MFPLVLLTDDFIEREVDSSILRLVKFESFIDCSDFFIAATPPSDGMLTASNGGTHSISAAYRALLEAVGGGDKDVTAGEASPGKASCLPIEVVALVGLEDG